MVPNSDVAPEPRGLPAPSPRSSRSIWVTTRALGLHVTLVVAVPAFLALFWWQVDRVRQGNTLSWAYVFEWPFFTAYAVYLWWKLVHDQPDGTAPRAGDAAPLHGAGDAGGDTAPGEVQEVQEGDEELAAYNRYLADLHASGRRKRW